jgi:MoxR-like ATPase
MALDLRYFEASMGPATSQWDLFGFRNANGDFVPGVMYEPYLNGGVMMLDEMDNANANVLTSLNSALAGDGATFPCGYIKKHKDFVCIAAGNTFGKGADRMYVGRNQLDAASLDRFNRIPWDYDEDAEFDWAGRDQTDWVKLVQRIRKCVFDHAMRIVVSPRASIKGAVMLRNSLPVEDALDQLIKAGISKDDWTRIAQECRGMMVNGEGVLL